MQITQTILLIIDRSTIFSDHTIEKIDATINFISI